MRATLFEFEQRFWFMFAIFGLGFTASAIDRTLMAGWLARLITPSVEAASPERQMAIRAVLVVGALAVFGGAMLRTWAAACLQSAVVHDVGVHADRLVADGPYRHVRNPLYLANLPFTAGIGLLASRLGWVVLVLAMWVFVYRLILREEDQLRRGQGERYAAYLRAVPRFWFSRTPRVPPSGAQPRWAQAFAGEFFTWLGGLVVLARAFTPRGQWLAGILIAGFLAYFANGRLLRRAATAHPSEGSRGA